MHSAKIHRLSAQQIAELPRDAAGRKCTAAVPVMHPHMTAEEVRAHIQRNIGAYETIHYVYVVDEWGIFIGVISLKELYALSPKRTLGEACKREGIVFIRPDKHQERVAYLALRHNIKAVPVVDDDHHLLGVISGDVILRILYKEVHEDLLRMAGVHHHNGGVIDDVMSMTMLQSLKHRTPWLFIGLVGGVLAASIIGFFEDTLRQNLLLAGFIPLVVYMASAVGTQTQTFIIRDLAMDQKLKIGAYLWKQALVTIALAFVFGVLVAGYALLRYDDPRIGYVLGVSMIGAICSSVVSGALVPYALSLLRMDPANSGGPLSTIIQDMMSITIYFTVATWMLHSNG